MTKFKCIIVTEFKTLLRCYLIAGIFCTLPPPSRSHTQYHNLSIEPERVIKKLLDFILHTSYFSCHVHWMELRHRLHWKSAFSPGNPYLNPPSLRVSRVCSRVCVFSPPCYSSQTTELVGNTHRPILTVLN
jgi:hypothetical protein